VSVSRTRVALWLWMVFAVVVWNVVFDRVIVNAGRRYIEIATAAAESNQPYANIEDTMRPARARALLLATADLHPFDLYAVPAFRRTDKSG
jgi:hypothetical protein